MHAKACGYQVVCLEDIGAIDVWDVEWSPRTLVVVGCERSGVPVDVLREADVCARIPMAGCGHSLNVASAASAVAVELVRRWRTSFFPAS